MSAGALSLGCLGVIASGVRGPLHLAAVFAGLWLASLAVSRGIVPPGEDPASASRRIPDGDLVLPLLLWAGSATVLAFAIPQPFLSDDFYLVYGNPYDLTMFWTAGGDGFYRPVGQFLLWVARQTIPATPVAWGIWGFALNLVTSAAIGLLAWSLTQPRARPATPYASLAIPFWSSALFLSHGAHPEAAIWVAGRFDVFATLFGVVGLLCGLRWARGGTIWLLAGSIAFMTLAISTKEIAYGYPLLFALCAWYAAVPGKLLRQGIAAHAAVAVGMLLFRLWMFQGIGGYADGNTGNAELLSLTPLHILKVVFTRLFAVLMLPVNWSQSPGSVTAGAVALGVLALAFAARRTGGNRRLVAFGTLWVLVAAAPGVAQLLIGPDLAKSRLLYLPSVGFCILLGGVTATLPRGVWSRIAQAGLILGSLAMLQHNLAIWKDVGEVVSRTCEQAAESASRDPRPLRFVGLPNAIHGVYAFANGFPVCVAHRSGRLPEEFDNASDNVVTAPSVLPVTWEWEPATRCLRKPPKPADEQPGDTRLPQPAPRKSR